MASSSRDTILYLNSLSMLFSYDVQKNQFNKHPPLPDFFGNATNIFRHLQSTFNLNQVKAIAFSFVGNEFSTFAQIYEFRLKCREFCQKHQIFCYFPYIGIINAATAISQRKIMVKEGEKVIAFMLDYPGVPATGLAFFRKNTSYQFIKRCHVPPFTQKWQDEMFEDSKPKRIIFLSGEGSTDLQKAQSFFKSYNPTLVTLKETLAHVMDYIVEKVLHLMGEKINPYDIETQCLGSFQIRYNGNTLIQATETDIAPFEKSVIINVNPSMSVSLYCDFPVINPPQLVKEIKLSSFKSKKVKVTFKLDVNSFYDFKVEPFNGNEEETDENVAKEKTSKENVKISSSDKHVVPEKARMVFDEQHFSVSYFVDGKEYNLNGSDGEAKTPIYISFHEKKPIVGTAAKEIYGEKPKFVVFDLIKLCSVSTDEIFNPKWGFRLSKDSESLIVTMETFEGERKSTVEFLLAIILKAGKDRIKKETGKRMEEIEIKFDEFSPNETVKKNFVEAGQLLKINILFV